VSKLRKPTLDLSADFRLLCALSEEGLTNEPCHSIGWKEPQAGDIQSFLHLDTPCSVLKISKTFFMYKFKIFKYFHLEISYLRKLQQVHAS
jgi:hypothetical protein